MDKFKSLFGQEEDEKSLMQEIDESCTLSWTSRIIGFVVCAVISVILSIVAVTQISKVIRGDPAAFAIPYTIAQIISIIGTLFLSGPVKQLKAMFAKTRIIATIVYLGSIVATLVVAFETHSVAGVIILMIVQFLAYIWYCLSFIPFARNAVIGACQGCCKGIVSA